ncbi:MAG: HAMP domain-containing histidine kinase, partial [Rhodoferax sp.]|nr:HAMP domain-containing histidine kinase [Rhodoferax sp.]
LQSQVNREREFASDVAHELRTPLAVIALQANVAATQTDAAGRAEALATLQYEALRAGQILGQLLDMARAQRLGDEALQEVPLAKLAARVMAGFAQSSHDSGHVLELVDGPAPVTVRGNPLLLELALRNLIANAIGHTSAGTLVRVAVEQTGALQNLSVSDNGGGADRPSGRPAPQNLGIGLRLVERISALHKAHLVRDAGEPPMTTRFSIQWKPDALPS